MFFSTVKTFLDTTIFELNENDPDIIPSGLTDEEFDRFQRYSSAQKMGNLQDWVRTKFKENESCNISGCSKSLGMVHGKVGCCKCGFQICNAHSLYQMKLSLLQKHDPVNGIWCRVCFSCYQSSRVSGMGVFRTTTKLFLQLRQSKVGETLMEANKIEKRVEIIRQTITLNKDPTEVVPWVSDSLLQNCARCDSKFSFLNRKHHCRTCGLLICHTCSRSIPITKIVGVRSCTHCVYLLGLRQVGSVETCQMIPYYNSIMRHKQNLVYLLSSFETLRCEVQVLGLKMTDQRSQAALVLRKQILESFSEIDNATKFIKKIPASGMKKKLYDQVALGTFLYLQQHMFSLQSLSFADDSTDVPVRIETGEEIVILESIKGLESSLNEAISKRKFEDVEVIKRQLQILQIELQKIRS